jgi:hypothetical protein
LLCEVTGLEYLPNRLTGDCGLWYNEAIMREVCRNAPRHRFLYNEEMLTVEYDLNYIEEQIKHWQSMKRQYLESSKEREIDENTQRLLTQIHEITTDNSIRAHLYKDTRTVPIVDKYYDSPAKFLIIERAFYHSKHAYISLIICKSPRDIRLISSELTMTNLKQEARSHIGVGSPNYYKDTRFYGLMKAITEVLTDDAKYDECIPFKIPCQFNAQRSANRTGYGNEYYGDTLMHEGTNYGETTTFAIIGIIIE